MHRLTAAALTRVSRRAMMAAAGRGDATAGERDYLAAELTRRQDWPGLWQLTLGLPLAEAAAAARRLPGSWRPSDEAAQALRAELAAARPAQLTEATRATAARAEATLIAVGEWARVSCCHFAADGSQVVVTTGTQSPRRYQPRASVHRLPDGRVIRRIPQVTHAFHTGTAVMGRYMASRGDNDQLFRQTHGGRDTILAPSLFSCEALVPVRDGLLLWTWTSLLHAPAAPGAQLSDVTPPGLPGRGADSWRITAVACDPASGRLAVAVSSYYSDLPHAAPERRHELVTLSPGFEVTGRVTVPVGTEPRYYVDAIGWYGPDLLVTREHSPGRPEFGGYRVPERHRRTVRYRSWLAGQSLTAGAVSPPLAGSERSRLVQPAAGVVVTDDDEYLDLENLRPLRSRPGVLSWTDNEEASKPEGFEPSVRLFISADGTYAAQYRRWPQVLEVRDLLAGELSQLLGRPLADATTDDLATVTRILDQLARRSPAADAGAGAARLLHACLAYQFGSDVKTEQPT